MIGNTIKNMVLGKQKDASEIFEQYWGKHGFKGVVNDAGVRVSMPVQRLLHNDNQEALKKFKGMTRKAIEKQMTSSEVSDSTPLVYDPEILSLFKDEAPFMEQVAQEGQQGYKAVFNRIDSRDEPLGFKSESDVVDLSGNSGKNIGFSKSEVDMAIYVDIADISDFTQAAAEHYMNVEDTTLGERVKLYARRKEQTMLYGNTSLDVKDGGIGDANGYNGLAKLFTDQSNDVDKSSKSADFVEDIRQELYSLKQSENVSMNDMLIVTSWDMFAKLSEDLAPGQTRLGPNQTSANVGIQELRISGVPVVPTHNVDKIQNTEIVASSSSTDNEVVVPNDYTQVLSADDTFDVGGTELTVASTSYSSANNQTTITVDALASDVEGETATIDIAGSRSDVFLVNLRATRFRSLVPFSTVPLGKLGLSERTALFEFGAMIERTNGNWGRYLKAYNASL